VGRSLAFLLVQAPLALLLTAGYAAAAGVAALADRSGRATREIGGAWSRLLLRLLGVEVRVSGLEHVPLSHHLQEVALAPPLGLGHLARGPRPDRPQHPERYQ
jgi:hypothetical protein